MSARVLARSDAGAFRAALGQGGGDGRTHFQHGPIDLVIEAFGAAGEVARAYDQAWTRFATILPELVCELAMLRQPLPSPPPRAGEAGWGRSPTAPSDPFCNTESGANTPHPASPARGGGEVFRGVVARRMWHACRPHAAVFITPMAAVAGAVADEVLAALVAGRTLGKAYVNNGGDIALYLAPGERFATGIVGDVRKPMVGAVAGIAAADAVRGIATSGWRGRSFSLGIADAVTVLARDAAAADAAATIVANAVTADHPAIRRAPARTIDPDSDLGDRLVTIDVGALDADTVETALRRGLSVAKSLQGQGLIAAAYLQLAGRLAATARAATGDDPIRDPQRVPRAAHRLPMGADAR